MRPVQQFACVLRIATCYINKREKVIECIRGLQWSQGAEAAVSCGLANSWRFLTNNRYPWLLPLRNIASPAVQIVTGSQFVLATCSVAEHGGPTLHVRHVRYSTPEAVVELSLH